MKFGACIGTDAGKLEKLKEYGYDYAEFALNGIADWSQEKVDAMRAEMARTGIWGEACNCFFAGGEEGWLTDEKVDFAAVEKYIRRALSKGAQLGLKVAVIGSGRARMVKNEADRAACEERFLKVLRLAGDIGAAYGVRIVIEPLQRGECNLINTVADGVDMCRRAGHENVAVLADFYHVFMNGETLDAVRTAGKMLCHTHLARANADRAMPLSAEDRPALIEWAAALRENGYDARMSLEGSMGDWDTTAKEMRPVLDAYFGQ